MVDLHNKKILMFSPYGATKHYGNAIKAELERRGAMVKGYDERPSQKAFAKILIRLLKKKVPQLFNSYIKRIVLENNGENFDYILICRGEAFNPQTIALLRKSYPKAKIILYLWDILRCADIRNIITLCDKAMSFDPQDVAENNGLEFRPTFYVKEYSELGILTTKKNDCVFIGTLHSNRHKIIQNLEKGLNEQGFEMYSYLYVPSFIVYLKDLFFKFPYVSINKVHFSPISLEDTILLLENSFAILDINYTGQKSLSYRAFEAMAAKRKYITTNPEVVNYDFYNPRNIAVININKPILSDDFKNTPFEQIPEDIMKKYSVEGLVDDLFA